MNGGGNKNDQEPGAETAVLSSKGRITQSSNGGKIKYRLEHLRVLYGTYSKCSGPNKT